MMLLSQRWSCHIVYNIAISWRMMLSYRYVFNHCHIGAASLSWRESVWVYEIMKSLSVFVCDMLALAASRLA